MTSSAASIKRILLPTSGSKAKVLAGGVGACPHLFGTCHDCTTHADATSCFAVCKNEMNGSFLIPTSHENQWHARTHAHAHTHTHTAPYRLRLAHGTTQCHRAVRWHCIVPTSLSEVCVLFKSGTYRCSLLHK